MRSPPMTAGRFSSPALPPDRYEIHETLGRGGMGIVYRATDHELGCDVALKTLLAPDPDDLYRLKREFRQLADLTHPNLVRLHDLFVAEDDCVFTMELVDGVPFIDAVRRGSGVDEARLRSAGYQLALGLQRIHAADKLHRDVKPSNILVTREGRVVLLDFGLVSGTKGRLSQASQHGALVGTLAYMAPEQARGGRVSPASDWFSTGVVLYEALTGRLPFEGPGLAILAGDLEPPPAPSSLVEGLPQDLERLVLGLLEADAARRPGEDAILAALRPDPTPQTGPAQRGEEPAVEPLATPDAPFVGRESELAALRDTLETSRGGVAHVVCIEGTSGIGKSALVDRFAREAEADPETLVLRSRCRPNEAVRYGAIDGLVDELSRHLVELPRDRIEAVAPRNLRALRTIFPVLGRVPFSERATGADLENAELRELRQRGFSALRELLARLADRQHLVLWIDDLQWGDLDSAPLLRELLRPPEAPAALFLFSYRAEDRERSELLLDLLGDPLLKDSTRLTLEPFDLAETRRLTESLLQDEPAGLVQLATGLVSESEGSPFLIGELARCLVARARLDPRRDSVGSLDLTDVVRDRVKRLEEPAIRLLQVVSVAGGLLSRPVALEAAGLGREGRTLLSALQQDQLLRHTTQDGEPAVETYHDRIRESVLARMPEAERVAHHAALLSALEAADPTDPDQLERHARAAGEREKAAAYAIRAADRATAALAFVRAAELYRRALDAGADPALRAELREKLADALRNAGRSAEAGPEYLAAAEDHTGNRSRELRTRAAESFLTSGDIDRGLAVVKQLLSELGMRFPSHPGVTALSLGSQVLRLLVRGTEFTPHEPEASERTVRADLCWSVGKGLAYVMPIEGADFMLRSLRTSLALGDVQRVGRSLAFVGAGLFAQLLPRSKRGRRYLDQVERLASEHQDAYLEAISLVWRAFSDLSIGCWSEIEDWAGRGLHILRERCAGTVWEQTIAVGLETIALHWKGDLVQLRELSEQWIRESRERGDLYGQVRFAGDAMFADLAAGDVAAARERSEWIRDHWTQTASVQHFARWVYDVYTHLYEGDLESALERYQAFLPTARRGGVYRLPLGRIEARLMEARLRLHPDFDDSRGAEIDSVESIARTLEKERRVDGPPHAALFRAGEAARRGDQEQALILLDRCSADYERAEMRLFAICARRQRGVLAGDDEEIAGCDEVLSTLGVAHPERWTAFFAPGF